MLMWSTAASAQWQPDPIVWVDERVSLLGRTSVVLLDVTNDTGREYEFDAAGAVTASLKQELATAGIAMIGETEAVQRNAIVVKSSLLNYEVGSAMERWLLTGGVTICSVRTQLLEPVSNRVVGEIISTRFVDIGGLFTVGTYKTVPVKVGKEIADTLIPLLTGEHRE